MFTCLLKIFIIVCFKMETIFSSPGKCPFFSLVPNRHESCYEQSTCKTDLDCFVTQKCCENPCGITKCYNIDVDPLDSIEKCPVMNSGTKCRAKKSKFCYKGNCGRCCVHSTICNPAFQLLQPAVSCYPEYCANHKCLQQGEKCYVNELTHEPYCKCISLCNSTRNYVCAVDHLGIRKTFLNKCYMKREACKHGKRWNILNHKMCNAEVKPETPISKPIIEEMNTRLEPGSFVQINCYGDRKNVRLKWLQRRNDGQEKDLSSDLVTKERTYIIGGRERKGVGLKINRLGYGSYGTYVCQQEFQSKILEESVNLILPSKFHFMRAACYLPMDKGKCNGNLLNYHFDENTKKCTPFVYGGCDGNANNFQTLEDCQVRCKGKPASNEPQLIHTGKTCGKSKCRFFSECKKKGTSFECSCPKRCPLIVRWVCASDGKSYMSACFMKIHACRWKLPLTVLYQDKCEKSKKPLSQLQKKSLCDSMYCPPYSKCAINPLVNAPQCICEKKVCSMRVKLVCGSDKKTYINECRMMATSCRKKEMITVHRRRRCEPDD